MSLDSLVECPPASLAPEAMRFDCSKYTRDMTSNRLKHLLSEINSLQSKLIEEKRVRTSLEAALLVLGVPMPEIPEQELPSQEAQLESEVDWLKSELKALRNHLTLLEFKSIDAQRCLESEPKHGKLKNYDPNSRESIETLSNLQYEIQEELRWMSDMNEVEKSRNNQMEKILVDDRPQMVPTFHNSFSNFPEDEGMPWSGDYSFDFWAFGGIQKFDSGMNSTDEFNDDDFSLPNYSEFQFQSAHRMSFEPQQTPQGLNKETSVEIIPPSMRDRDASHACVGTDSEAEANFQPYRELQENLGGVMSMANPRYSHQNGVPYFDLQKPWDSTSDPEFYKYEDKAVIQVELSGMDPERYIAADSQGINPEFQFTKESDLEKSIHREKEFGEDGQLFEEFDSEYGWQKGELDLTQDNHEAEVAEYNGKLPKSLDSALHRTYIHIRSPTPFEIPPIDLTNFKPSTISQPIFEDCLTSESSLLAPGCGLVKSTDSDDAYREILCSISEKMVEYMAFIYERHVYRLSQKGTVKKKSSANPLRLAKRIGLHSHKKKKSSQESSPKLSSWYSLSSRMKLFKIPDTASNSSAGGSPIKEEGIAKIRISNYSDSETDSRVTETDSELWNFEDTVSTSSTSPSADVYRNIPLSCMAGRDPYGIAKDRDPMDVGTYSSLMECTSVPSQPEKNSSDLISLKKFETLAKELEYLDPSKLEHDERLAFWINIYNSILMHSYIIKGCPSNYSKRISLMGKTTINVGGHSISALEIEYGLLRAHSHRSSMAKTLKVRLPVTDPRASWALTKPEPLVTFALATGARGSPKLLIFNAKRVREQIENAKYAFMRAAVGLNRANKLSIPKLILWYGPDFCSEEKLIDWVLAQLPPQQTGVILEGLSQAKQVSKSLCVEFAPFDWSFRYLFEPKLKGALPQRDAFH